MGKRSHGTLPADRGCATVPPLGPHLVSPRQFSTTVEKNVEISGFSPYLSLPVAARPGSGGEHHLLRPVFTLFSGRFRGPREVPGSLAGLAKGPFLARLLGPAAGSL